MKEREPLDLDVEKPKKNPGDPKPGEVRNPVGKPKGAVNESTKSAQKTKADLFQAINKSMAPTLLRSMLDCRVPVKFLRLSLRQKIQAGGLLTEEEEDEITIKVEKNFWRCLDFLAKIFPKKLMTLDTEEETQAARTRRATVEAKSPKMIDMVRRKRDPSLYEA